MLFVVFFLLLMYLHVPGLFWTCGYYFFLGFLVYIFLNLFSANKKILFTISFVGIILAICIGLFIPKLINTQFQLSLLFPSIVLLAGSFDLCDVNKYGRKVKGLGDISYSLYLVHVPIQIVILICVNKFNIDQKLFLHPLCLLGFISICVIIASLSYKFYEYPIRNYLRKRLGA
jgi:peptidoglycan/LPS O-acetylase OafA/YrhL